MMDYSQMELRIMRQALAVERWSGWWKQGWNLDFAPGSLRTCSFVAFALGYGILENAVQFPYSGGETHEGVAALGMKVGRTTAMAKNFALLYGGTHG